MTTEILGRREDQRLEFKSKAALDSPETVARAVAGMLNAGGGEVWIGVEERQEEGKAAAIDPVPEPGRAGRRLQDYLVDVLDPSPTAEEVAIEPSPADADPALLVVQVHPAGDKGDRGPYALRKGGAWHFVRRVGARNHPMSREEIFGATARGTDDRPLDDAIRALKEERQSFRNEGGTGLWIAMRPARTVHLDPQDERLSEIALDPSLTGNRRAGWHFASASHQPRLTQDGIEWGLRWDSVDRAAAWTHVAGNGELVFRTALEWLHWKGEEREIWPLILLEYPISAFRIARVIYRDLLAREDQVVADLALLGAGGWGLRAGSPGDFFFGEDLIRLEESDLIWEPVAFPFGEIDEHPDRCGFRLVRRVYQAFGIRQADMPREYDPETGRLILPE